MPAWMADLLTDWLTGSLVYAREKPNNQSIHEYSGKCNDNYHPQELHKIRHVAIESQTTTVCILSPTFNSTLGTALPDFTLKLFHLLSIIQRQSNKAGIYIEICFCRFVDTADNSEPRQTRRLEISVIDARGIHTRATCKSDCHHHRHPTSTHPLLLSGFWAREKR